MASSLGLIFLEEELYLLDPGQLTPFIFCVNIGQNRDDFFFFNLREFKLLPGVLMTLILLLLVE